MGGSTGVYGWLSRMTATAIALVVAQPALANYPRLAQNTDWVPAVLIVIGVIFLLAIPAGLILRIEAPEEIPPTHSTDEPPGTLKPHEQHPPGHR